MLVVVLVSPVNSTNPLPVTSLIKTAEKNVI